MITILLSVMLLIADPTTAPTVGTIKSLTLHKNGQNMPAERIATATQPATQPTTKQAKANMKLTEKLASLNITLPPAPKAAGAYIPAKKVGDLIFVSGQIPMKDGKLIAVGQVPSRCAPDDAKAAAKQCVLNALAAVSALPGGIDQITGVARVGAFISSDKDFTQQPSIANGASEFLIELFGDSGRHARAAIGTNTLPLDAAVEVEFIFMTKN